MKILPLLSALGLTLMGCTANPPRSDTAAPDGTSTIFAAEDGVAPGTAPVATDDPYLWLEDVTGEKALEWVRARNAESSRELSDSDEYKTLESDLLKILDSDARIPTVTKLGPYYYNFWKDAQHVRGIWRRTTLAEYRKKGPKWETVIDLDALGKLEGENWVWHGASCLEPDYRLCLVNLSRGGADAQVVREFDLEHKAFVAGGFRLEEAKNDASWIDADTLYVSTDFGPDTMTTSGYPRIVKEWKRGTPLADAKTVFEVEKGDVGTGAARDHTKGFVRDFVVRIPTFFTNQQYLRRADGTLARIEVPDDAESSVQREWLLIKPRTPWTVADKTYAAGALLAARFDDWMAGKRELTVLFEPTATTSLSEYEWTRHHVLLNVLDDVKNRVYVLTPGPGAWKREPLLGAPKFGTISVDAVDSDESDDYFMTVTDYLTPTTLHLGAIGKAPEKLKETPAFFDAKGLAITQHFAKSEDGTRVPYFQVSRKEIVLDGSNPTLLYGYGGFEVSLTPAYSGTVGRAWLSRGGVFVVANIRGGGEYGPGWHRAALKANRNRAYEDFAAVGRDLVARKLTSVPHLGIQGGSNGGLLMGNMVAMYPELFGAVVCQVPLLDMKRYSHLLAGASWMEEYGDPDKPEEWAFLKAYSPYQNVQADKKYPPILFMTSTRDDRVHPGHARKMMARMKEQGHDVRYYENIEGGHGGAANNAQQAHMSALAYTFLWKQLK